MDPARVLQAVTVFGSRLRGLTSDLDTPAMHAWLAEVATDDAHGGTTGAAPGGPTPGSGWRRGLRAGARRLPAPARRAARWFVTALRDRRWAR